MNSTKHCKLYTITEEKKDEENNYSSLGNKNFNDQKKMYKSSTQYIKNNKKGDKKHNDSFRDSILRKYSHIHIKKIMFQLKAI